MNARRIAYLAVVVAAAASIWYFFLYLVRWEWNRALVSGIIFLAAEVALFGSLLLERLTKLRASIDEQLVVAKQAAKESRQPRPQVLARIHAAQPEPRNPFAWLRPDSTNVFVPVLLGAGVVVSAIAWLVERIARATAGPRLERGLALRLDDLQPPADGLVGRDADPLVLFAPTRVSSYEGVAS
ncbi:MAG TPA: hypothetical protein VFZ83_13195 [Acidimicrobiia bacterium]|nr:hypothetical protein [Acidimicrobiia bacterium]